MREALQDRLFQRRRIKLQLRLARDVRDVPLRNVVQAFGAR